MSFPHFSFSLPSTTRTWRNPTACRPLCDLQLQAGGELLQAQRGQLWPIALRRLLSHLRAGLCPAWDPQRWQAAAEPGRWAKPRRPGRELDGRIHTLLIFRRNLPLRKLDTGTSVINGLQRAKLWNSLYTVCLYGILAHSARKNEPKRQLQGVQTRIYKKVAALPASASLDVGNTDFLVSSAAPGPWRAHCRGRVHHRRHGPLDGAAGQQPAQGHRGWPAGKGGAGLQPGVQPAAVYPAAPQAQPVPQLCRCLFNSTLFLCTVLKLVRAAAGKKTDLLQETWCEPLPLGGCTVYYTYMSIYYLLVYVYLK